MKKPSHHIFVCGSFRVSGEPQGVCNKKGSMRLMQYLEGELSDRGLGDVVVSSTGCLKTCEHGPAMVIYPPGWWYGEVDTAKLDIILDALEDGQAASELCLS